jgi:hypothetical protein
METIQIILNNYMDNSDNYRIASNVILMCAGHQSTQSHKNSVVPVDKSMDNFREAGQ